MSEKSEEIRCRSRIDKIRKIVDSFYESLPHPHDFHPSVADVCWIPEVQETIISGTDEEFEACKADTRARLPELSATWLEERRNLFLTLLPQQSPTVEILSLATTIFCCTKCNHRGMPIEKALSHPCKRWSFDKGHFKKTHIAKVFEEEASSPWDPGCSKYTYSERYSNILRGVVLKSGEDPDTITTKEMNRKGLRFASFQRNGLRDVLSWHQVVNFGTCAGVYIVPDLFHTISSSTGGVVAAGRPVQIASFDLTNCQSLDLSLRRAIQRTAGVASGVGE